MALSNSAESDAPANLPDSIWQLKPWWCQPWSILLTGIAVPAGTWTLWHQLWLTLPVVVAILLWWVLFLVIVPTQYSAVIAAERSTQNDEPSK